VLLQKKSLDAPFGENARRVRTDARERSPPRVNKVARFVLISATLRAECSASRARGHAHARVSHVTACANQSAEMLDLGAQLGFDAR